MRIWLLLIAIYCTTTASGQSYYLLIGTYTNKGSNNAMPPQDSTGSKGIYVYRWDAAMGQARFLSHTEGVVNPSYLEIAPDGHGVDPVRQEKAHVHSVVFSPDYRNFYAQDLGLDLLDIFQFNSATSEPLVRNELPATVPGGGPRHMVFHPNGRYAYLVEELGGCVDVYRWYPGSGHLDSVQRVATHPDTAKGPFRSADLHVSPDGRFLYVTNRESESNITIFSIDGNKGTL